MINTKSNIDKERLIPFFVENSSQPFATADPDGKIIFVNKACCDTLGYTEDEFLTMDWAKELTPPGWSEIESIKLSELHRTGEPVRYEKEYIHKNGTHVPVELLVHLVKDNSGAPLYYYTFVTDLTERKLAETKLKQSIVEKEILMKELQHRVKNNMNIVASLLDLEMEKLSDEKAKDVFINARSRIFSMSSIYERLYTSGQIDSIDLYSYINDLTDSLSETYVIDHSKIIVKSELEHIILDLRRAVPVGLIVNELVSNALKYAYPGNNSGKILIILEKHNNKVTLRISDNGIGLPDGFNLENNSDMGLILVSLLTDQIKGKLRIENSGGTSVIITFEL
jgi:PAS domain S-box-containing protein